VIWSLEFGAWGLESFFVMNQEKDIHTAKTVAISYLSRAPRSINEVELKLKQKGIAENILKETINSLINIGYLNDETFARQWANSKIKFRLWGRNKIIHGLKQKGISDEIINQTLMDIYQLPGEEMQGDKTSIRETAEFNTAKTAIEKWFKSRGPSSGAKGLKKQDQKARAYRYLQAKGFPTSVAIAAIKECFGAIEKNEGQ
jgi:regulatory protein